jgi:hypothetical protein
MYVTGSPIIKAESEDLACGPTAKQLPAWKMLKL